jgi:hypothetical protein
VLVPRLPGADLVQDDTEHERVGTALREVGPAFVLVQWYLPLAGARAVDALSGCLAFELRPLSAFNRLLSVRSLLRPAAMEHLCTASCRPDAETGATEHSSSQLHALNQFAWNGVFRA